MQGEIGPGRHYNMMLSENNHSSVRKKEVKLQNSISIHSHMHNTTNRTTARHRHNHIGLISVANQPFSFRGVSRTYVDERLAALLAMIVDLQAQIGG